MRHIKTRVMPLVLVIISISLIFCIYDIYKKSSLINELNFKIKILQPKYTDKDTIELLNLVFNIKEFDNNSNLLDTSRPLIIFQYPYITNNYKITKFGKSIKYFEGIDIPCNNGFVFNYFYLYPQDSAFIFIKFNESRGGQFHFKKESNKWILKNYQLGRS